MKIRVNGSDRETKAANVGQLLTELNLLPTQVAIEHNGVVLFRHEFADKNLHSDDQIEIVRVVAGG